MIQTRVLTKPGEFDRYADFGQMVWQDNPYRRPPHREHLIDEVSGQAPQQAYWDNQSLCRAGRRDCLHRDRRGRPRIPRSTGGNRWDSS
jgi:hypothetical protein